MIKYSAPTVGLMGRNSLMSLSTRTQPIEISPVKLEDFPNFNPEKGYVYAASRAISSRVNANYDGWPVDQIKKSYKTFVGRPIYVEHNNSDPERARGVILDAVYKESKLASGVIDASVYCLMEVDAETFPKLAGAIMDGKLKAVSMGADVDGTQCSACGKYASKPSEYCVHIPRMKGRTVTVYKEGKRTDSLVFESCIRPNFFELSFVFDPADESAWLTDKRRY